MCIRDRTTTARPRTCWSATAANRSACSENAMIRTAHPERITATPAARAAISRLRAARGEPVMFVQSGGCCAGSTPMCFPAGEFLIGEIDVLLGEIDGCPFYIDKRLDQAWHQEQFLLDVASGEPEDFSL